MGDSEIEMAAPGGTVSWIEQLSDLQKEQDQVLQQLGNSY